ncbi:glycosyltransferase family 2 protein [uncultured Tateyamaria sp.]|uniref:glycosyltransferase family 2 protein n=1 Tax=uncultured Tateyamaria sp. TaxID=455651 RepID=UPI0026072CCE|nr:glycosyltransferase family 2 protein [uncultured Tateyamaria sp.]
MVKWGLSATILAPTQDILRFAAHHIELGAHRLYIYLDDDNQDAFNHLKKHPKVRVQTCDATYWKQQGGRPVKHQVRQTKNATHAYNRRPEVDWLIHMDADEFLVPDQSVSERLVALDTKQQHARVRPMEVLGGSDNAFKAYLPPGSNRAKIVRATYPTFGAYVKGGFLSHVAGKLFVRTGLPDIQVRIHNAFQSGQMLANAVELPEIELAHCHAKSWEAWRATYAYRLEKGSYRADLKPAMTPEKGGMTLHEMFKHLEATEGEDGLRAFYDEVIGDSPDMRARLQAHGLLREVDLNLDALMAKHFPNGAV